MTNKDNRLVHVGYKDYRTPEEAIDYYIENHMASIAIRIGEENNIPERSINEKVLKFFEEIGDFISASRVARILGNREKAEDLERKTFSRALERGEWYGAYDCCKNKFGTNEDPAEYGLLALRKMVRDQKYQSAAELAEELGDLETAFKNYCEAFVSPRFVESWMAKEGYICGIGGDRIEYPNPKKVMALARKIGKVRECEQAIKSFERGRWPFPCFPSPMFYSEKEEELK